MADPNETRTTLTGKPIEYKHEPFTSMMFGATGFVVDNGSGANLLPPGYTDSSLVHIPITTLDIEGEQAQPIVQEQKKKGGFFRKLSNAVTNKSRLDEDFKIVMMSRGDYLKYWVKGEDGDFLPSVVEPPEGRKEWVRKQLELNKQWKEDSRLSK